MKIKTEEVFRRWFLCQGLNVSIQWEPEDPNTAFTLVIDGPIRTPHKAVSSTHYLKTIRKIYQ